MYAIKCLSGVQILQPSKIRFCFMKYDFNLFLRWIHKSKISFYFWHSFSWSPTAQFFQWPGIHVHLLDLVRVTGRRVLRESGRQHGAGPQGEDTLRDSGGSRVSNRVQVGLRIGDLLGFCAPGILVSSMLILTVPNSSSSLNYFIRFSLFFLLALIFYCSNTAEIKHWSLPKDLPRCASICDRGSRGVIHQRWRSLPEIDDGEVRIYLPCSTSADGQFLGLPLPAVHREIRRGQQCVWRSRGFTAQRDILSQVS